MFCERCGAQNEDGARFCRNCGAQMDGGVAMQGVPVQGIPMQEASVPAPAPKPKNRKVAIIAGVAIVVVAAILLGVFLLGGRSYEKTIEKFVDAQFHADAGAIFDLIPKKMISYVMEEAGYDADKFDAMIEDLNEEIQEQMEYLDALLGEEWKLDYKIQETEDVTGDRLDRIKENHREAGVKVSAAKIAEVELTISAGDFEQSNTMNIALVKVGRSWYLDVTSMGSLF